ncbi:MAG: YtxH domain-containing protein [Clostridium sp.]|nr:YtxH domain-containing protein [Clostridium sp.]
MALYNLIEKKRKEKRKKIVKTAAVSTLVGGTLGVLSGVLLAPKSGKDTREDIKEKMNDIKVKTIDQSENLKNNVKEAKNKIKDYLREKKDKENFSTQEVATNENDEILIEENTESDIIE